MFSIFRPFLNLFRSIIGLFVASADEANDALLRKNPNLIRREGKKAKEELQQNYKALYEVIGSKVGRAKEKEAAIARDTHRLDLVGKAKSLSITTANSKDSVEKIGYQLWQVTEGKKGATKALQARAVKLGISNVNDPIAKEDPEFIEFRDAIAKFTQQESDLLAEITSIESELKSSISKNMDIVRRTNSELIQERARLRDKQRAIAEIDGKTEDVISDILGAEEAKKGDEVLKSISDESAQSRLAGLERLRQKAVNEIAVADSMGGGIVDSKYLKYAENSAVDDELNSLLSGNVKESNESHKSSGVVEQLPNG